MNQSAFEEFGPKGAFRLISAITEEQITKLPKLRALQWTVTKVYFANHSRQCALVLKQPGAVGILYPNGTLHRPGGSAKTIMLDRDLLEKNNTVEKTVA